MSFDEIRSKSRNNSVDWSPKSNSKSRTNSTDSDDGIPNRSRNPMSRISQYITEDEIPPPPPLPIDGSNSEIRPARRRVVSMDSEADERVMTPRQRKPRRQMSEIEEDSSMTRARRQSMSTGGGGGMNMKKSTVIVKGMDPFVAMLPRAHRILKYRTIYAKLDIANTGNLTLPLVEVYPLHIYTHTTFYLFLEQYLSLSVSLFLSFLFSITASSFLLVSITLLSTFILSLSF